MHQYAVRVTFNEQIIVVQAAQERQAKGLKRSAAVMLSDEPELKPDASSAADRTSDMTGGATEDGMDDMLPADEDDMEEEVVGEASLTLQLVCAK